MTIFADSSASSVNAGVAVAPRVEPPASAQHRSFAGESAVAWDSVFADMAAFLQVAGTNAIKFRSGGVAAALLQTVFGRVGVLHFLPEQCVCSF